MSIPFQELRHLRQLGLSMSAVLVLSYLNEHGFTPIGKLADACELSVSSVEKALAKLKALQLLPKSTPEKNEHDHDQNHGSKKGTEQTFTARAVEDCGSTDERQVEADPICEKLLTFEVLPWCVDAIMTKLERGELRRDEVERQLEYHEHRVASGFKFKAHPARFVFSAILKGYAPPEGYHVQRYKAQEGVSNASQVSQHPPLVQQETEPTLTPEETIRNMLKASVPAARRLAVRLAQDWGVDIPELASVAT